MNNQKKLTKGGIVLLVFATLLVLATAIALTLDFIVTAGSLNAIYGPDSDGWDALGGVFLFIYTIILSIVTAIGSLLSLPFTLSLIKKHQVNTWYTKGYLIFAIAAIVLAALLFATLPVSAQITSSSSSSISSSSI